MSRSDPSPPHEVYWDHCATTPLSPGVIEAMSEALKRHFANPSSAHRWGQASRDLIESARASLAALLGVQARELFFTSGATESNQIALLSTPERVSSPGHIITQETEHSAVLGPINALKQRGYEVSTLRVNSLGLVSVEQVAQAIRPETQLVSIMHANNEIGTVQPIAAIGELIAHTASPHCLFHVDGAQSTGKIPLDLDALQVDLFSLSAHKFNGPKGIGALYIKRRSKRRGLLKLPPISFGGGQERGVRPGTLATHQIIGLGVAAKEARSALAAQENIRLKEKVDRLWAGLQALDPSSKRQGTGGAPHVLSVTVSNELLSLIEERWAHIAFSRGSACHSSQGSPSHVLTALGLSSEEASRTLRFGLGLSTSIEEIDESLSILA